MTVRQYGLWTTVRELQNKIGFAYFDGDTIASYFKKTSRDVIYDDCTALLDTGWFDLLAPRTRSSETGLWNPRKIKALSHKEWCAKYADLSAAECVNNEPIKAADQSLPTDWTEGHPVAPEQLTSRSTAINQSLPSDIDTSKEQMLVHKDTSNATSSNISKNQNHSIDSATSVKAGNSDAVGLTMVRPLALCALICRKRNLRPSEAQAQKLIDATNAYTLRDYAYAIDWAARANWWKNYVTPDYIGKNFEKLMQDYVRSGGRLMKTDATTKPLAAVAELWWLNKVRVGWSLKNGEWACRPDIFEFEQEHPDWYSDVEERPLDTPVIDIDEIMAREEQARPHKTVGEELKEAVEVGFAGFGGGIL